MLRNKPQHTSTSEFLKWQKFAALEINEKSILLAETILIFKAINIFLMLEYIYTIFYAY